MFVRCKGKGSILDHVSPAYQCKVQSATNRLTHDRIEIQLYMNSLFGSIYKCSHGSECVRLCEGGSREQVLCDTLYNDPSKRATLV